MKAQMLIGACGILILSGCGGGGCDWCTPATYAVGGTVSGLVGSRLTLANNGVAAISAIGPAANGTYPDFFAGLKSGAPYSVSVATQPTTPPQVCVVANGTGTIANANISNISVTCTTKPARFLYTSGAQSTAVTLTNDIWGYAIDATSGALTPISGSPFAGPAWPMYSGPSTLIVSPSGKFVYQAFVEGQVPDFIATFAIDGTTGAVSLVGSPIENAWEPLSLAIDPAGNFLYVLDGHNTISVYRISDSSGELTEIDGSPFPIPGGASYSLTMHPFGRFAYVPGQNCGKPICADFVSVFAIDSASGALAGVNSIATAADPWAIIIDPSGKFAYVANAGSNNISAYAINAASGALTALPDSPFAMDSSPYWLAVDPFGKFLYVLAGPSALALSVYAYGIDSSSGTLKAIADSPFAAGEGSSALVVDPTGQFLYVLGSGISGYVIDSATGGLTPIHGSPFANAGTAGIAISQ